MPNVDLFFRGHRRVPRPNALSREDGWDLDVCALWSGYLAEQSALWYRGRGQVSHLRGKHSVSDWEPDGCRSSTSDRNFACRRAPIEPGRDCDCVWGDSALRQGIVRSRMAQSSRGVEGHCRGASRLS